MGKHRTVVGLWLCVLAAAWALSGIGAGLNAIADNDKYVNDVMIPTLVLLAVLAAVFVRVALRLRRRMGGSPDLPEPSAQGSFRNTGPDERPAR